MELLQEEKTTCYHCGEACEDDIIMYDDNSFCCHGCKAVYELIKESDLQEYYSGEELKTGKVPDQMAAERKFHYLDLPEVVQGLLRYQDEQISLVRFHIPGIHCSSCIYLLEHLPKLSKHILKAEVNFIRKEVAITFDHHQISLKQVAVLLSGLGYAPAIHLDSLSHSPGQRRSTIGMKIAVAGFCFGNSMLISLPEYLDTGFQLESSFKSLFGWINLLLAFPVVFYAASDYFVSSWRGLKHGYLNIDVPISLGILTLFLRSIFEIVFEAGPGYVDSLNGLIFFLLLGKWYQGKTYEALSFDRDYTSYFPISVTRLLGKVEESVMIRDLKAGDHILIHNQELIPADGIIEKGTGKLDYSFVTGESEPVYKRRGERVFAGGRQAGGQLEIRLEKAVNNSELTQLWNSQGLQKEHRNQYNTLIDQVSKYFTITIVLLAVGTAAYWWMADPGKIWNSVTAVLIIACPCALALTIPFSQGHSMRILGAKGIYLKNAGVIETISRIREIVFDKTGTLTKNDPMNIRFCGETLNDRELALIKTVTSNSAHPLSRLITNHLPDAVGKLPIDQYNELVGQGVEASIGSDDVRYGSAAWLNVALDTELHESQVHLEINGRYKGYFSVRADYRAGIFDDLRALRKPYKLHLLSGDNETEEQVLKPYFDQVNFNQKPVEKLAYIRSIPERTLMIGDGLNDAGALKSADAGFAVCEDIHQFSPACDAMIAAEAIGRIPDVLKFSKGVIAVAVIAFLISFSYNVVGLSFAVTGNLTPIISAILMPISSVSVVGFITIAVNALGRKYFAR